MFKFLRNATFLFLGFVFFPRKPAFRLARQPALPFSFQVTSEKEARDQQRTGTFSANSPNYIQLPLSMVSLKLQKRLAASILNCGKRKIWLDPNEVRLKINFATLLF